MIDVIDRWLSLIYRCWNDVILLPAPAKKCLVDDSISDNIFKKQACYKIHLFFMKK